MLGSLCVVTSTWVFVLVASRVVDGRTKSFDDRILVALRTPATSPGRSARTGSARSPATSRRSAGRKSSGCRPWPSPASSGSTGGIGRWGFCSGRSAAAGLSFALKSLFDRPRPDLVPHLMGAYFSSFPSGHSMMSAVVYGTLGSVLSTLVTHRRLKFYFLALAAIIAGLVGSEPGLPRRPLPDRRPRRLVRRPGLVDHLLACGPTAQT